MTDLGDKGLGKALQDGQTLFSFLGQFWHHVYEDPDFAERFCEAAGLLSAQMEQRKNEAKAASGRRLLPAYSRERWMCVKLHQDTRNAGKASVIQASPSAPVLGPQTAESGYIQNTVPVIGPGRQVSGQTTYVLPASIVSAESLHERAFDPEISLDVGTDFTISEGSIVFEYGKDPVSDPRFRKDVDGHGTVVWLKNALVDKNFVSDYAGYVLKMHLASSQRNLDTINAFWDIINTGATVGGLSYFVCKALGVPCAEERETVKSISRSQDGYVITTDKHSYESLFEPSVSRGQVLTHGAPLTKAVRLVEKPGASGDSFDVLFLKQGFFLDKLISGLGFSPDETDIVYYGQDENGHPKLKFAVYGNPVDADAFFEGCWRRCEEQNVDMSSFLPPTQISNTTKVGDVVGTIRPASFMLDNLVGSNVVFVRIDLSLLDEEGRSSAGLLSRAFEVTPPGVCLMFCATPGEVSEDYGCRGEDESGNVTAAICATADERAYASEEVEVFVVPGKEVNSK